MTITYLLVSVCIWVLGFHKLEALGALMGFNLSLWIVAKLLCTYLCMFDTIAKLHAMDEKYQITFSLESESGVHNQ
jgi:hypothetical protein